MTAAELRNLVTIADIYKMSLGRGAQYRAEALSENALVFASEKKFFDAAVSREYESITHWGRLIKTDKYPFAGAPDGAISIWQASVNEFRSLPKNSLILHWEAARGYLYWGIATDKPILVREEADSFGQPSLVFHRPLLGGWRKESLGGIPLSNLHPKARDLSINLATLNRISQAPDYFRNLILDQDTSEWERKPSWEKKAKEAGWHPKDIAALAAAHSIRHADPLAIETADFFIDEAKRMAATAMHTVAYSNGQSVTVVMKAKDTDFTRQELETVITKLLVEQKHCCALTGYKFRRENSNPHLRTSLDRKDSSLGYIAGNLQVVTRAANFFKSASDQDDWLLKATAMELMAVAIQQRRKSSASK